MDSFHKEFFLCIRFIAKEAVLFRADHGPFLQQQVQVSQRLPHGKPFLVQRELVPVLRPNIPGHPGGDLVGGKPRGPFHDGPGLRHPVAVVGEQGVDAGGQVSAVPVAS